VKKAGKHGGVMVREIDVRQALHEKKLSVFRKDPETLVIDELGLCQGEVRIDIAVINGNLHGYEIKSEKDTLDRLPSQQQIYSKILDTVTLVAAENHLERAIQIIPKWWGIIRVRQTSGRLSLRQMRPARSNTGVVPYFLAQLLWRDEALEALESLNLAKGLRTKPRNVIWETLAASVPVAQLSYLVRTTIKKRANWRSGPRQKQYDDSHLPSPM
jgi:hypothetical protein